jgi:hypothetical protein
MTNIYSILHPLFDVKEGGRGEVNLLDIPTKKSISAGNRAGPTKPRHRKKMNKNKGERGGGGKAGARTHI